MLAEDITTADSSLESRHVPSRHLKLRRIVITLSTLASLAAFACSSPDDSKTPAATDLFDKETNAADLRPNASMPSTSEQNTKTTGEPDKTILDDYDDQKIANYYAAKYRRNPDYLLEIVRYVIAAAKENDVSPFVLLAIISHESNFLHTARSLSGAEGLMQIMTPVHKKRFENYGGIQTTFVPEVNIRVGAAILKECIGIMKSVRGGLRCYAGTITGDDAGFVVYVLAEAAMLKKLSRKDETPTAPSPTSGG